MKIVLQIAATALHLLSVQSVIQDLEYSIQLATLPVLMATGFKTEPHALLVIPNVSNVMNHQPTAQNVFFLELI